jgi:hypothetical protein
MARVDLLHLIQDRQYLRDDGDILLATPVQTFSARDDGGFRDGPVHPRVAVVDLDAETNRLRPPTRFRPQAIGRTVSAYQLEGPPLDADSAIEDFEIDDFIRLNPFATVLKTLALFESPEILGRRIPWAFPSEQLLIVPRAGEMRNAFYDRSTGSLQFFYHHGAGGYTVYTALSHDIIVHETTHAILDGLHPDLYHASNPQSLAIHEALADLAAITQTLLNDMIVFSLDSISSTNVDAFEALSLLAEEFGTDTRVPEGASFLRRLKNKRVLSLDDDSADELGLPNRSDPADPHALSQVLSGAVYAVFEMRMRNTKRSGDFLSGLEDVFLPAARRVARIVFRAIDYLPPGEASFIDYGRAFLNASAATYKRPQLEARTLAAEFVRRGIVSEPSELETAPHPGFAIDPGELDRLAADGQALETFARRNRAALGIPAGVDFETLVPAHARRALKSNPGVKTKRETIFRFRWRETETHDLGPSLPKTWSAARGTTLVVDESGDILSLLTTDPGHAAGRAAPDRASARSAMLKRWASEGRLVSETEAVGPDGRPRSDVVLMKIEGGAARAEGGGRTLHIARDFE